MARWAKVMRAVFATAFIASLVYAGTASPAEAVTRPVLKLKANETKEIEYPTPLGAGLAPDTVLGALPEDCADDGLFADVCDYIPLRLVDEKGQPLTDLTKAFYSLTFTLSWQATNYVIPGTGTVPDTQLKLGVWDDPVVDDEADEPTDCDPDDPVVNFYLCYGGYQVEHDNGLPEVLAPVGGDPGGDEAYTDSTFATEAPINFGLVPKRTDYGIVVGNLYGPATAYKLKVSLVKSEIPTDLSIDELIKDLSSDLPPTPSADFSGAVPALDAGPTLGELGLADIGADSDLDSLGLSGDQSKLEREVATDFARRAVARDIRAPSHENGFALFLWLIALPVAIAAFGTAWFLRRRSALFT